MLTRFTIIAAWALIGPAHAMATEISPTPTMLAGAEQMIKLEYPDDDVLSYEYHFRNVGGHLL
jgi:hypothetical protein